VLATGPGRLRSLGVPVKRKVTGRSGPCVNEEALVYGVACRAGNCFADPRLSTSADSLPKQQENHERFFLIPEYSLKGPSRALKATEGQRAVSLEKCEGVM